MTVQTPGGPREIYRTVGSGGSFGSNPLRQEIGLGNAEGVESVEIYWPASGIRQILKGLEVAQPLRITFTREGDVAQPGWVELRKRIHFRSGEQKPQRRDGMKMETPRDAVGAMTQLSSERYDAGASVKAPLSSGSLRERFWGFGRPK